MDLKTWRAWLPLFAALVIGTVLRLHGIESRELDYDEAATGYFGSLPFTDLWDTHARLEPNPPLFYSLAWLVEHADGSVEQIRYLSVAASVTSIFVGWSLALRLAGKFAANAAAWLLATSATEIVIGQYARTYAVLTLLLLTAAFCLVRADQTGKRVWWGLYLFAASAALYAHYTAAVMLLVLNASMLIFAVARASGRWRFIMGLLISNAVVAVTYAPWLPVLLYQVDPPVTLITTARRWMNFAATVQSLISDRFVFQQQPWLNRLLIPLVAIAGWRLRASRRVVAFVMICVGFPLALVLVSRWHPLLNGKTLAASGTLLLVAAALGLSTLGRFRVLALALVVLIQLRADFYLPSRADEGWREVAGLLRAQARQGDTIYLNQQAIALVLRHYDWPEAKLDVRSYARPREEPWFRSFPGQLVESAQVAAQFSSLPRVWLLTRNQSSAESVIATSLEAGHVRFSHTETKALGLTLFGPELR